MKERRYKHYLLVVLLAILAFNYVDRLALGIALQDIKTELSLSDTQLGAMTGIAFALFYSTMGIPIARWADRGNRITIISTTTVLWSAAVALCGLARSYVYLLLVRICVAVGEAGCIPPAHALIADQFSRPERPKALAIYMLGGPLSMLIGYFAAGWLTQLYGWRLMFLLISLPGVVLATLTSLTLVEPRRKIPTESRSIARGTDHEAGGSASQPEAIPSIRLVWRTLWSNATFRSLLLAISITYFFGYGILQWQPAFFVRRYQMVPASLGTWFAVIYGLGGLIGTYWGGAIASRLAGTNESRQLRMMAMAYCAWGAVTAFVYLAPSKPLALAALALASVGGSLSAGPLFATVQGLVSERMRAVAVAIIFLFANLIGMGLGPLVAGVLSDGLRPWLGDDSLRYALLILSPGYLWAAVHLMQASKTVARDVQRLGEQNGPLTGMALSSGRE